MSNDDPKLQGLYPFMDKPKKEPRQDNNTKKLSSGVDDSVLLTSIRQKAQESIDTKQKYFKSNEQKLLAAAKMIAEVYKNDGKMLTMGNGGSNCDASHLAVEFLHPVTAGRQALPAINLGADSTMVTAAGNDLGYENAFIRQLIAHSRKGDILIGFSTSGCSNNLMNGFRKAKSLGLKTLGFSGVDGGDMLASQDVDVCLVVESKSIHRIQESHLTTYHILWDLVHFLLADDRKSQVNKL